jgi:hypothetical protein
MSNLDIYNNLRAVPKEALKEIQAGRLKGKSDINPMWRIKALTEQFGPCGIGWKYVITDKRLEHGGNNEISAFVDINLYFKHQGEWSEAIPGTGGSSFVANEKNGPYVSDECFKMALTDAISVACKALGVGADVYWEKDRTKYSGSGDNMPYQATPNQATREEKIKALVDLAKTKGYTEADILKKASISDIKFIKNEQIEAFTLGFSKLPDKQAG